MENQEYDYFTMGINSVKEGIDVLRKKADEIEELFGADARLEFEAGIASMVPSYNIFVSNDMELDSLRKK